MERRLAAILAADVVGYSRLMSVDEEGTLERLKAVTERIFHPMVADHKGRIVKLMGDGLLAEYPSVVAAVESAASIQQRLGEEEACAPEAKRLQLRIGINLGDIIVEGSDIYGDGVNVAARLEGLAAPGGICISGAAFDAVEGKVDLAFEDMGLQHVKNIARPIRTYRLVDAREPSTAAEAFRDLPRPPDKPAIAVLPFNNMSGDPEQEYLADGLTEDIISALSRLRWFLVIARNSTFVYKGRSVDIKLVGRELGVHYVLEGSVRKAGKRVRVAVQLVDASSGAHHWAQKFDRDLDDIFALQDDIAQSVTAAIEPKLLAAEGLRSENRSSQDLGAWDLVARAMTHFGRMTTSETKTAIDLLRIAVRSRPDYGPAHSLLAFALFLSSHIGWTLESEDDADAADLARRAAQLDDDDPWAHLALGCLAFNNRETAEAVREFRKALDLNPNFAMAHGYLGWALALDGQLDEAVKHLEMSLRLSPNDPLKALFCTGVGVTHYLAGRYDEAVAWARISIGERPGLIGGWRILCASLAQAGQIEEARKALKSLRELQPGVSLGWIRRYVPYTERTMQHFIEGMEKAGLT